MADRSTRRLETAADAHAALDDVLATLRSTARENYSTLFGRKKLEELTPVELQAAFETTMLQHQVHVSPAGPLGRALFDFYLACLES